GTWAGRPRDRWSPSHPRAAASARPGRAALCPDAGHRRGPGRRFGNMADDADSAFTGFAAATVEGLLGRHPEWATSVGSHRYDDRLTVGTAGHYAETSRWAGERLAGLAGIDTGRLSPQHRVDAQILENQLARLRFMIDELREHEWNPMAANPGRA